MKIYFKKANNPELEVIFENSISLVKSTLIFIHPSIQFYKDSITNSKN
ncbi:hypothetical protein LEP1GSC198_3866 [Leptospira kirschneri str. JB]|nr:hypothetical protein LEP1GSC198_3866 [Leptospira kirschneri str. JB]